MAEIARSLYDLNFIDTLSCQDSVVHRIDPRAKLVTFVVFMACVVSFDKYEVSGLIPFFFFPAVIIPVARIPARYLVRKMIFLLPFAVAFGGLSIGAVLAMLVFLLLLVEGLVWAWRKGVLTWQ